MHHVDDIEWPPSPQERDPNILSIRCPIQFLTDGAPPTDPCDRCPSSLSILSRIVSMAIT
jgi:hypothetical protein